MNPYRQDYLNHRMGTITALVCGLCFLIGTLVCIAVGCGIGILVGAALVATCCFAFFTEFHSVRHFAELMDTWDGLFGEEDPR